MMAHVLAAKIHRPMFLANIEKSVIANIQFLLAHAAIRGRSMIHAMTMMISAF
jgi:hypothetical protein